MLYVYYGEDGDTARKKVQATVSKMLAKNSDALYFRITSDTLAEYNFEELTGSQALFKNEYIVVLDTLLSTSEGEDAVVAHLEHIAAAPHPFFILDGKLRAPLRKKLEKYAESVEEFTSETATNEKTFNTFSLTDALGERDVKKLWTLFREAKQHGVSDEEIHGILFWMFKSMALAINTHSAEEAGMKAFPYNKAKRYSTNYSSPEQVMTLVQKFALLPQHARRSGVALEIELERFILEL